MRHAVLAAAIAFGPHMRLLGVPARSVGRAVMSLLDRRRESLNRR
ncbi:MAG: hypothetical protein AB8H79_23700 [Myxococcota bacterium]